ncbi:MAG: protein kinase [Candidatus Aminicenantes bacterium]|nr:protein kinase [Candidatus Aminicenantes bacterium]
MGEVYLAEDTKLERQVALKFLPRHMTDDKEARLRFEREAKAAAALNHPNIVTVYEIGEHEDQVFIAMEHVEGQTLKELISSCRPPSTVSRLPISQVLEIATQIASGLAAAHAKGIVHRDIKPQNILIDKDGRVKILDFGLAKLKGVSPLTQRDFAMGTVHYMSPEQGMAKEVDPRSDIWSLGVVLYEMISGELPFRGDYDQAVIYAIVNEDMVPLQSEENQVAPAIEKIIRCCLAKKRQDRYPSAEALAGALRDLQGSRTTTKPEKSSGRRLSRRAFLTALSLLLLAGILAFFALNPRANSALRRVLGLSGLPRSKHMAVLPLLTTGDDTEAKALGDGFTTVIINKLTWLEKFHDSLWTVPADEVFENRGKPPSALRRLWNCNLFISGNLETENNSLRLRLKLEDAVSGRELNRVELQGHMGNLSLFQDGLLSKLGQLLGLRLDPTAVSYVNTGGTAMPGAFVLFVKGKGLLQDNSGMEQLDKGIVLLEKALQQDSGYVQARLSLAEAMHSKFMLSKDQECLQKSLEHGRMAKAIAGPWLPAQLAWAQLLKANGQRSEALTALQEVLSLNQHYYQACIELANAYSAANRASEAEELYKRAISLRPGYPPAYHNLAYFYDLHGRLDEALVHYQKQAELAPGDFNCLTNMGNAYLRKGDRTNAKKMYEQSNAIQPNVTAQSNLATLFFYEGNYPKALPLFKEVTSKSSDCWAWGNLADTYRQIPEHMHEAGPAYQKAISLAEADLQTSPENSALLSCLAMYYAHSGEKAKALAAISSARLLASADPETIRRAILVYEAVHERIQALNALHDFRERLGSMEEIEKEPDLAHLRRDPEYRKIAQGLK